MSIEKIKVKGMTCNHCVSTIEKALQKNGVKSKVNLKDETVEVEFDETKIKLEFIKKIISENGYDV